MIFYAHRTVWTCSMRLQIVGELLKQIDVATSGKLLTHYPEIAWRSVFGLRI